jgi:hypothetical protein
VVQGAQTEFQRFEQLDRTAVNAGTNCFPDIKMFKYWNRFLFPIQRGLRNPVEPRTQVYQPRLTALSKHSISAQLLDWTFVIRIALLDRMAVNAGTNRFPDMKMLKYWNQIFVPDSEGSVGWPLLTQLTV